jgi:lysophospholipase L1-like esterase
MHSHVKALFLLFFSALIPLAAHAAPPAPTIVFIGDQFTFSWGNSPGAFPSNWVNQGWNGFPGSATCPLLCDYGTSGATMERFQTDVVARHPAIVHIMVGADDADIDGDSDQQVNWPEYLSSIQTMVDWAHAANIHVILGIEPVGWAAGGTLDATNTITATYGNQIGTTVVNYAAALGTGPNQYQQSVETNGFTYLTPTAAGYALMSQMAAVAIDTMNQNLLGGYLQDLQTPNNNLSLGGSGASQWVNVNTVYPGSIVQFTPYGVYSGLPAQPFLNASYLTGSTGTWASSNPLVMTVSKSGQAYGVSPGNAIITYTSPSGVKFNEWKMTVLQGGV